MKIILPFRRYVTISLFLLFSLIAFSVQAQNCMDCMESTQTLQSCDTNGDGDAGFDLDDDITVSNAGNAFEFYTGCSGSGTLTGQITGGGTINNYQVTETTTIYARELSGPGGSDTCVQIVEVTLVPLIVDITPINGTACADSPLTLTANVNGVSGSASYQWKRNGNNIGSNSSTFDATLDGTYTVEVTDFGCTSESTNDVMLTGPTFTGEITASSGGICSGGPSVTLTATPNTGDPDTDYSYVWSTPGGSNPTSRSIVTTTAGNFSVTITEDASGCGITEGPFNLADESITFTVLEGTDPTCLGGSDGEIEIRVSGGSGDNYTFSVEGESNQTGNDPKTFSGLEAGTYGVTVTDNEGGGCSVTGSVTLDPGRALTMMLTGNDPTTLGGSNGSIDVSMMNGFPDYEWDWDKTDAPTNSGSGSSGSPGFSITGLAAGDYTVTVVDDDNTGCTVTSSVTLDDLVCTLTASTTGSTATSCVGEDDGTITVNVSGEMTSYKVIWSGPSSNMTSGLTANSYVIPGLLSGTYNITVEDVAGCVIDNLSRTVVDAPAITFNRNLGRNACTGESDGEINVTGISNGSGTYTVSWTGPSSSSASVSGSSYTITGLPAGPYTISVEDNTGCESTDNGSQVTVGSFANPSVTIVGDNIICSDDPSTTLSTSPSNFSSYSWDDPGNSTSSSIIVNNPGVTIRSYGVTVEDNNMCEGSANIQVQGLAPISISLDEAPGRSKISLDCASDTDGKIFLDVSGGDGNYSYNWSGPGVSSSASSITNLGPGTYNVTVTDDENCSETFSQSIIVPQSIQGAASAGEVTCNGDSDGQIVVSVQGGTPPYKYLWPSPINASQSSDMATGVSAGTYNITIEDDNGCFIVESATVTEPNEVNASIVPSNSNAEVCLGEEITLTASGGTSYSWSSGQNSQSITVSPNANTTYMVTVTDAQTNFCTAMTSILVRVNPLPVINVSFDENSGNVNDDGTVCEGDLITLSASGGSSYVWEGGNSNPYTFTPPLGTSSYTVTVTDAKNCVNTELVEVSVDLNPVAIFDITANLLVNQPQKILNISEALCGELVDCVWEVEEIGTLNSCDEINPSFPTQGTKNFTLTVENSCGCFDSQSGDLEIRASDQCAVTEFTINGGDPIACVGQEVEYISSARPSNSACMLQTPQYSVTRNGITMTNGNQYNFSSSSIVFNEPGIYKITYFINDGSVCGCTDDAERTIEVIDAPDISFATDNPLQGCGVENLTISFGEYDAGDQVLVNLNGVDERNYESSSFVYSPTSVGLNKLEILSVGIGICNVPVSGEVLEIDVFPEFKIVSEVESKCDDDLRFEYTVVVEGGDPNASLMVNGIEGGTILDGGNTFQIGGLIPGVLYEFEISKGDACAPIPISFRKIQCDCTFTVGGNVSNLGFESCEGTPFEFNGFYNPDSADLEPMTDTLVYMLHQKVGGGSKLGEVVAIYPITTTMITSDFNGFLSGVTYRLSVVGVNKAALEDGLLDFNNPTTFSNGGEDECLSVGDGVPVVWRAIPKPELRTIQSRDEICKNAYDFPVFVGNQQANSSISFEVPGLGDGNIRFYGFQDTAFIHFEDNGQDSFNVIVTETRPFTDQNGIQFECSGSDTLTLYVVDEIGAPPLSEIIYWPGNILASTADSSTTCFQWGRYRGTNEQLFTENGDSKYFYVATDANLFGDGADIYFVDTYFCENPDCVTRVFFNNDGPIPGLFYKEEETFQYLIKPNPNDGLFTLNLFSKVEGRYSIEILNSAGTRVHFERRELQFKRNDIELNLRHLTKGIYFIRIFDEESGTYSTDKVIIN